MELQDLNSPETVEFVKTLSELAQLIKAAFQDRTPHLNSEKYLTGSEVCKYLHISARTLQEYRDTGKIGYIRLSGKILYRESDILRLLEDNYVSGY